MSPSLISKAPTMSLSGIVSLRTIWRSQIDNVQPSSELSGGGSAHLRIVFTHLPDHLVHEFDELRVFVEANR